MAKATMYSKKDKTFRQFPIKCEPSKEDCEKCPLKNNCDEKKTDMKLTGEFEMRDIRGKRIVGYEAACDLKMMGFDWQCTGYYHCDDYGSEEGCIDETFRYECVGWRGLYRNSYSLYRAAAPTLFQAKLWLALFKVKQFIKRK